MKNILRLLWAVIFLVTSMKTLHAEWTQTNGPLKGGTAFSFAASGSKVYAATTGGVFVSSDTGRSWKAKNNGLTDINAAAILVNGS